LENNGSLGFGVSSTSPFEPRVMRSTTASGFLILYFLRIRSASWNVESSGQVGPEEMIPRSSPTTSEMIRDTTVHDLSMYRISCPPLTADKCLRTEFISCIVAPERRC